MERQKPQGKKRTKKSKVKGDRIPECAYETLPQEVENIQVSDSEESNIQIKENVPEMSSCDESSRLLCEDNENLEEHEIPDNESSSTLDSSFVENPKLSNYQQDAKEKVIPNDSPLTEFQLNEIQSHVSKNTDETIQADTKFESPLHVPSSPSLEATEDLLVWWKLEDEGMEIANEASPSASVLQFPVGNPVETIVQEVKPEREKMEKEKPFILFGCKEEDIEQTLKPFSLHQLAALYQNAELDASEKFVADFVEREVRGGDVSRHQLYELLTNYSRARGKLSCNNLELSALKKKCANHQSCIWSLQKNTVTEHGECQDGNPVKASHEFKTAHFSQGAAANLSRALCSVRELVSESFSMNAYTCHMLKLQVEDFIQKLEADFAFLTNNAPVNLLPENLPHISSQTNKDLRVVIEDMRQALSVLFTFQRRPLKDEGLIAEIRVWLTRLVAVLLRVATWKDHLFLLLHVLRCPAGVGKWATSFIQPPTAPYNSCYSSEHLDHLVTCLATILLPVQARDLFLNQLAVSMEGGVSVVEGEGDSWFIVDSDGEEEADALSLRESDMVALLNQVPFDTIFRLVLNISVRDDRNVHNIQLVTDHHILKLIAFCHLILSLLERGLNNHATLRYRQYAKRLGRLVRHTAQYATDQWQLFKSSGLGQDPAMMLRLSVEYDALLSRAVATLYHSPGRSAWQFLAVLPFGSVSIQRLWQLLRFLILGTKDPVADEAQWNMLLEEQLAGLSDAEIYYLLTAINTMALSRTTNDWEFIRTTTLLLLEIGFLNQTTRDSCQKSARIMLTNLTIKYPALISDIFERLNVSQNCDMSSLQLIKDLPINLWRPTDSDLNIVESWLIQSPIQSVKHSLGRRIVSSLNVGFATDDLSHELFLPRPVHVRLAMMVLKTAVQCCPQSPPEGSTISDTVKQMATLAAFMARPNSTEQAVTLWVWQMAYKLRLHLMDQSDASVRQTLSEPSVGFSQVPEPDSASEEMELISKHLKNHQAMAVYMSLQVSALGHQVPLICNRGFALMSVLQSCQLYTAVISLLQHIVPLFLESPNTLLQSDKFRTIVLSLLSADRTFFKAAKSLVTTDNPGHILQQFGDMIQYHLNNYSKYNLMTSTPLAQLWLQILCIVWSEEPTSASYLMDVVLSCAFFRSDITSMAYDNLGQLLQTLISTSQANSRLSSLFSWMSGSSVVSLVPQGSSCPQAPWFAYFALHVEEFHSQKSNGLWREIVKELALTGGKPNVDNSIKKACGALKIPVIPASALSVYRWGQQALDTSVDHPVLPLLWQRFFILFFTRLVTPSGEDHGSIGHKLFEGMTYQTYHKRLRRKLNDCVEYFKTKAAAPELSEEKHLLYDTLTKLYETFSLWLDEPRLHEPTLYLPALPPQYNPLKLSLMTSAAEQNPWFEYVDYESVRATQNSSIERWQKIQGRDSSVVPKQIKNTEDLDPIERINKRLQSYDCPVPPPPLRPCQPVIPPIHRDALRHKGVMLDTLRPSLKAIVEYAQSFSLRQSEHLALDCSLQELLPTLYNHPEREITLHAACDTADPRARPPSVHTLTCAGPAVIYLKIRPATVNEGVKQRIDMNRAEMEELLKRSLQPPPFSVCVASILIEHATRALENECAELRRIGDVQLLNCLKEVGVTLFYHLSGMFTDDATSYLPLKQLLTTCIESLGNLFISGEEQECARLLTTVLGNPGLAGLLGPHFSPSVANPATFLDMYCTLVDSDQKSPDLIFVLLSKFDLNAWLAERRPKLVARSQVIELAGKALATAGITPSRDTLTLLGIFRNHLATMFTHDFPEHYGEVLALLLRHSETQSLSPDVWYDLINAMISASGVAGARLAPGLSMAQVKEVINRYATEQRVLSVQQLRETANMLGDHFTKERLQYGLYGLYPKYRIYVEPLMVFQGMILHALVVATLQNDRGSLSDKLCEKLWPFVAHVFNPWLGPYFTQNLAEPTAAWIQQLTDDRSVLLPWIVSDGGHANRMSHMFIECVRFVMDTLPAASTNILSCLWQYYVSSYAHSCIKDYILSVIHGNLICLSWHRFYPTLQDIDFMLKVVDQYLPDCHTFVGAIFIQVPWAQWIQQTQVPQVLAKMHSGLLHLLIKLANEPNVRQSGKITPLLVESQQFGWHLVECNSYDPVVNWYVMSYDPRVILQIPGEDGSDIDMAALDLLEMAAGYSTKATQFHNTTTRKRQMFIRACVKLLMTALSRHKQLNSARQDDIRAAVRRMVDQVETVVTATVPGPQRASEAGLLLSEILVLVNQAANSVVATVSLEALLKWLDSRNAASVVVAALLRVLGITVHPPEPLGMLLEASLTAFFRRIGISDSTVPSWSMVVHNLQPIVPRHPPLEDSLVANGHLLSLYALSLKHLPTSLDVREEANLLNNLNQWLANIKLTDAVEAKLPLLWSQALYLVWRQCEYSSDAEAGPLTLRRVVASVAQGSDSRAGAWGLLGAIGIVRSTAPTNRGKLVSRFLVALVLAQLPDSLNDNGQEQPQFVRTKPHAPGAISATGANKDYGPSAEAMKALAALESLATDKSCSDITTTVEYCVKLVRQAENSLHNAHQLVMDVARQLYPDPFLHAHRLTDKPQA